jgi:hypothetical protein
MLGNSLYNSYIKYKEDYNKIDHTSFGNRMMTSFLHGIKNAARISLIVFSTVGVLKVLHSYGVQAVEDKKYR